MGHGLSSSGLPACVLTGSGEGHFVSPPSPQLPAHVKGTSSFSSWPILTTGTQEGSRNIILPKNPRSYPFTTCSFHKDLFLSASFPVGTLYVPNVHVSILTCIFFFHVVVFSSFQGKNWLPGKLPHDPIVNDSL